jgi:hypothetical protein
MMSTPCSSVVVATHGHCFDGMCSAALFTRLLRSQRGESLSLRYVACGYGPDQKGLDPQILSGTENAILDFRYTSSPRLNWYFDHHATAFTTEADRLDFQADGGRQKFYDPTYGSCSKLIFDVSRERFGLPDDPIVAELVHWADMIDAARFPSAEMAVMREHPALWLMTVVENQGDDAFLTRIVPRLLSEPLEQIAKGPDIEQLWIPLRDAHFAFADLVRKRSSEQGAVVHVDLTDEVIDVVGKFVTYALFPKSVYSVMVSRGRARCKISVGYNPWCGIERKHDIAEICRRYGGGGHKVVGAVTLGPGQVDEVRQIAQEITRELNG